MIWMCERVADFFEKFTQTRIGRIAESQEAGQDQQHQDAPREFVHCSRAKKRRDWRFSAILRENNDIPAGDRAGLQPRDPEPAALELVVPGSQAAEVREQHGYGQANDRQAERCARQHHVQESQQCQEESNQREDGANGEFHMPFVRVCRLLRAYSSRGRDGGGTALTGVAGRGAAGASTTRSRVVQTFLRSEEGPPAPHRLRESGLAG